MKKSNMKKFTILTLLVTTIHFFSFGQNPNVTSSDISYWVGNGTNEAILVIYFQNEDPINAYAWGYRWNGSKKTVSQMLTDIDNTDKRLNIAGIPTSFITGFEYNDNKTGLNFVGDADGTGWMYAVNTTLASGISTQDITNGDIVTFFTVTAGFGWDNFDFTGFTVIPIPDPNPTPTATYTIHSGFGNKWATQPYGTISYVGDSIVAEGGDITYTFIPNAGYHVRSVTLGGVEKIQDVINNSYTIENIMQDDTLWVLFAVNKNNTIATNDILYWIGEGSNEVIFAANWCNPEIAFAWGYRFSGEKVLVSKIMEDIKASDSRFDYTDGGGYVTEITYQDSIYDLALVGSYWMYNVNEGYADGINTQYVYHNDIIEFGDESCGISDDFWTYVWATEITPVSSPSTTNIIPLQQSAIEFTVYPNPANNYTLLNINGIEGNISLRILDVNGKVIQSEQFHVTNNTVKQIKTSLFAKGMYFVQLQNNNTTQIQKLIIY